MVVLDSCASGALIRSKGGVRRPSFVVPEPTAVRGHAYLTSSSADEAAQESDALGGSFFTHFLVSGLRGAADARGDGRVTLDDAYRFAARETLARTARTAVGSQHATYDIRLSGSGDIVLSDLHRASASLVLGAGFAGHLFVYDDRDRLSVELEKPEQREMEVGLAPGRYSVVLRRGADVLSGAVELHRGCTVLAPESLAPTALEPARTRGQGADPGPGPSAREPDAMKVASPAAGGDRPRWPLEISFGVTRIPILFFGYAPTDSLGVGVDWTFQRWGDLSLLGGGLGVVHVSPAMGASSTDWSSTPRTHAHLLAGPTLRYAPFERLYVEAGPVLTMHFNYFEDLPVSLGSGLRTGAGFVFWAGETQRWLIQASVESTFQMGRGNLFFQTFGLAWQR